MKVIDPGHKYELATLDGGLPQILTFVKRHDPKNPQRFPGNFESHPGTTLQNVLRVLLERFRYLDTQIPCLPNKVCILQLRLVLWLLEFRAARRHGRSYWKSPSFAEKAPMCIRCGHTVCHHKQDRYRMDE